MAVRFSCVLVVVFAVAAMALDSLDSAGIRIALRVFDECSKSDGFSPCLKKKALTFLDRLGRMEKLTVTDEIAIVRAPETAVNSSVLSEEAIDKNLPRGLDARDQALTDMLWNKVASVIRSKNIEFSTPRMSDIDYEEARKGDLGFGGGKGGKGGKGKGGKGGKKGGGLMMGMMMGMVGKMMGLIPIGIAGLFLLAGKALITSKIALLISGIIAIKKLIASKNGGGGGGGGFGHGHGGGGGHHSGGGGGGWGGGWDRRSLDESHKLAYNAYTAK